MGFKGIYTSEVLFEGVRKSARVLPGLRKVVLL